MTVEETIRQKQRFKKSVDEFLSIATALTNNELELALAQIADWMNSVDDDQARDHWKFRGQLLKSYYDLRLARKRRLNFLKRLEGKWNCLWYYWTTFKRVSDATESDEAYFLRWLLRYPIMFPTDESELHRWSHE